MVVTSAEGLCTRVAAFSSATHPTHKSGSNAPHAQKKAYEAQARADPAKGEEDTSLAGMTHRFRNRVLAEVKAGAYTPAVDAGVQRCSAALPWWWRNERPVGRVADEKVRRGHAWMRSVVMPPM